MKNQYALNSAVLNCCARIETGQPVAEAFTNLQTEIDALFKSAPDQITFEKLEKFLQQPGINIAGVCKEAQITEQYLNRCRKAKILPGKKVLDKLLPVIKKYGF